MRTRALRLGLVALALAAAGCDACNEADRACTSNSDCRSDELCVDGICRLACNSDHDCLRSETCEDGVCVVAHDAGAGDAAAADAEVLDSTRRDAHAVDLGTRDTSMADRPADAAVRDAEQRDSTIDDAVTHDLAVPDAAPANLPPEISAPDGTPVTYASSEEQSYPLASTVEVSDPDGDLPVTLALVGGEAGCDLVGAELIFTPLPGFSGLATCTVQATDSGSPAATGAPVDFLFEVLPPRASCHRILTDPELQALGVGQLSGRYRIDPDGPGGAGDYDAYCDMGTLGGGWTLALRARTPADGADVQLQYDSLFWISASAALSHDPSPRYGVSEKYQPFNTLAFSELLVGMVAEDSIPDPDAPQLSYLVMATGGASLLDVYLQDDWISPPWSQPGRDAWLALLAGATLQPNCNREGLSLGLVYPSRSVRIGISGNDAAGCLDSDSFIGIGSNTDCIGGLQVGVSTCNNGGNGSQIHAFAVVFVRDSAILSQAVRRDCVAHWLAGERESGLYVLDPDGDAGTRPLVSFCEMELLGGGWTLVAVNGDYGFFTEDSVLEWTVFGTPTLDEDFRSQAFFNYPVHDLLFRSASPALEHAYYLGFGDGTSSVGAGLASISERSCALTAPNAFHLSGGDLDDRNLCERTLYINAADQDGRRTSCSSDGWEEHLVGFGWSVERSDGCPMDDPATSSFITPWEDTSSPFGESPVQVWVRSSDFTELGAAPSCQAHRDQGRLISGTYRLQLPGGGEEAHFCLMTDSGEGWLRVAALDLGHDGSCPGAWQYNQSPRACGRYAFSQQDYVRSAVFPVGGYSYQRVRGLARGYQSGVPDAFVPAGGSLDDIYVDGLSITHGAAGSRTHIWTYALGARDFDVASACPCRTGTTPPPPFVGGEYYCDSAYWNTTSPGVWYADNPLFDDLDASDCYLGGDPAWFEKVLPQPTTDDIEVRLMADEYSSYEDFGVTQLELYVR